MTAYQERLEKELAEFNAAWPYRIDLKLPLDEDQWRAKVAEINAWIRDQQVHAIGGPAVPYDVFGFTHLTLNFKDERQALICKLTWSGK